MAENLTEAQYSPGDILDVTVHTYIPWEWYDNGAVPGQSTTHRFCQIHLFPFAHAPVSVDTYTVFWCHGTTAQGLKGILNDKYILPTMPFSTNQAEPFSAFMCLACKMHGDNVANAQEMARVMFRVNALAKNRCGVFFTGFATGKCSTVDAGGAWETLLKAKQDLVVHNRREKRWAVKCDIARLQGLAFAEDALPGIF